MEERARGVLSDGEGPETDATNLLVVGSVPAEVRRRSCRRLLGGDGTHRRLFARCSDVEGPRTRYDDVDEDPTRLRVVEYGSERESGLDSSVVEVAGGEDALAPFGAALSSAVGDLETVAGGSFAPREFRAALDPLSVLFADHGTERTLRFLHLLTERFDRTDGLAVHHVRGGPDDDPVQTAAVLFDDVVELRAGQQSPEWRWRGPDGPDEWTPF
jgi:hypothetical protein